MKQEALQVREVSKRFGNIVACDGLSFDFKPATCTAIIGPNGAGKTTIMNIVAGSLLPDGGSVRWLGQELIGLSQDRIAGLGVVRMFQDLKVFDSMTAYENLLVAAGRAGTAGRSWSMAQAKARSFELIEQTMDRLNLTGAADRLARELSYAERKLIALGRAICANGEIYLLDEPASGMDKSSLQIVLDAVVSLREDGKIVVIVEHNLSIVQELASHALLLEEGKIVADGLPRDLFENSNFGRVYFSLQQ